MFVLCNIVGSQIHVACGWDHWLESADIGLVSAEVGVGHSECGGACTGDILGGTFAHVPHVIWKKYKSAELVLLIVYLEKVFAF